MMKAIRFFPFTLCVLGVAWLGGFLSFIDTISTMREQAVTPDMFPTDAIVVLTGGSDRLAKGVELLQSGKGKKLFVSGVHQGLTVDGLIGPRPIDPALRNNDIVLGYKAGSTIGNADETKAWMRKEHYTSMRLVTANYHMPRSLLLFRAAMPEVDIIPAPVTPDNVRLDSFWRHPGTIELVAFEYVKFLLANVKVWVEHS